MAVKTGIVFENTLVLLTPNLWTAIAKKANDSEEANAESSNKEVISSVFGLTLRK
jgi:hypothetical protein